jgi:hypothetical protein
MKSLGLTRGALTIGACGALLAGCGASPPPIAGPGAIPQSRGIATRADRGKSWMLPEAKSENLLYVSSYYKYVNVYSYPKGKLVGTLTGFGILAEDCSDKLGNVWIIDNQYGKIYEYAHGGVTPIATLTPPSSDPLSCAVSPRNGDLAVGTGTEELVIYPRGTGMPIEYADYPVEGFFYCGYDPKGNLFISALTSSYKFQFAELVKGASSIANIALDQSIELPGGVAAKARQVAVGDEQTGTIYEFQISGSSGTKVGTTPLSGASQALNQFLIDGGRVVAAVSSQDAPAVDFFDFPAGGTPIKSITRDLQEPLGVAISLAPR